MSDYIASVTISAQTGFETSAQYQHHLVCSESTTIAELIEWRKTFQNCFYVSAVSIAVADTALKGGDHE